ncbi:hypothetical protein G7Y79_00007g022620 [Physcia stellaris]|nr:hypothetical protein G7Y79_00007g022620 [Physcia stellaris]
MCQIQTAFWSCGQLAEGRTVLCHSYQHTKGRYCDGFSSFSRPVKTPCPNCQAGRPHPPSQQMSAAVQVQRCVRNPAAVPTPTHSSSAANVVIAPMPETGKPADGGNSITSRPWTSATPPTVLALPAVTAPQKEAPTDSQEPTKSAAQHAAASESPDQVLSEMERTWQKLTPKAVPVPVRISTAGAIKKPYMAPATRRQPRALTPTAKKAAELRAPVAQMVASQRCSPATIASSSSMMGAMLDSASLWRDLSGVSRAADADVPVDPALRGV